MLLRGCFTRSPAGRFGFAISSSFINRLPHYRNMATKATKATTDYSLWSPEKLVDRVTTLEKQLQELYQK